MRSELTIVRLLSGLMMKYNVAVEAAPKDSFASGTSRM